MSIVKPLATGVVNGKPVRFFRSPLAGQDFPWHAFMDLHTAMDLSADEQEHFLRMMRSGPYKEATRVVATVEGPAVIAAHFTAQGFIGALEHLGRAPMGVEVDYYKGLADAVDAQAVGMSDQQRFSQIIAMGRRNVAQQVPE